MASNSLGTLTLDLVAKIGGFTQSMDRAAQVVDSRMKSIQDSADRAKKALTGIFAIALGGYTLKGLADMADQYGQMANRIRMATVNTDEYNQVQQRLLQTANTTYRPLAEAQELYIRTADSIKSLGYNVEAALDITDSFSYLLVTNAASADRANTAISALSKSIQTGKVSADSWQSILAATPTIVESIAKATGKTTEQIRALGIQGKLSLNDLLEGLRKNVDANKKLAQNMDTTINDSIIKLKNNISAFVGEQNSAYGVTATFAQIIGTLADNVELLAAGAFVIAAGKIGAMTASMVAGTVATANNTKASIENAIAKRAEAATIVQITQATLSQVAAEKAFIIVTQQSLATQLKLAQTEVARNAIRQQMKANAAQLVAVTNAEAAATTRLATAQAASAGIGKTLLGVLGGPVGIGLTVATAAASWLLYKSNAQQANQVNVDLTQSTEELKKQLGEMSKIKLELAIDDLNQQKTQALQTIDDTYSQLREIARKNSPGSQFKLDNLFAEYMAGERDISSLTDTFFDFVNLNDKAKQQFREVALTLDDNNQQYRKTNDTLNEAQQKLGQLANVAVTAKQAMQDVFSMDTEQAKGYQSILDGINNRILNLKDSTGMLSLQKSLSDLKIPEGTKEWDEAINKQKELISLQNQKSQNKIGAKTENDIVKAYQNQVAQLNQQIALFGQTTNVAKMKYELANGELKTLSDTEKQLLINKSIELDQLNTRKEFDSLMKELRTDEEKARDTLAERVKLLKDANIQGQQYADAMAKIAKATITDAPKFSGIDPSIGGAGGELVKVAEAGAELEKWRENELAKQQDYLDQKLISEQQYADNVIDINKRSADSQQKIQEGLYSASLGMISSFTGDAADMFKQYAGESSAAYKIMFAASKAASIAQAIIAVELAALKAPAEMNLAVGIPMATAIRAAGYASIGMMAATSIAGMAHDGIDNIPKEGTWLLDKGERVLSPRQNRDLVNYMNNTPAANDSSPQVNIVVNNNGTGSVDTTQGYEQFGTQAFTAIKEITRSTIIQERRKGGLLDPNNRRAG